MEHLPWLDG
ncbi:unnamed protein product [Acanthoscelides obtectus]|uniref:Uncharacterized protein n=1 Tax=Acanthoscelides obtectus TaxID=200917 RepID=A0A9P0PE57_ACAOB|nr:unnamed protein product [Acanthoscelides obtectus]CAK1626221.1 hypothetical protein AOBTE_LOCUS3689 [Acanthoscelides obtectus]